jgi:hypothetical protein
MSGHARSPGLHDFLRELAFKYAFVLDGMGLKGSNSGKFQESKLQIKKEPRNA